VCVFVQDKLHALVRPLPCPAGQNPQPPATPRPLRATHLSRGDCKETRLCCAPLGKTPSPQRGDALARQAMPPLLSIGERPGPAMARLVLPLASRFLSRPCTLRLRCRAGRRAGCPPGRLQWQWRECPSVGCHRLCRWRRILCTQLPGHQW